MRYILIELFKDVKKASRLKEAIRYICLIARIIT